MRFLVWRCPVCEGSGEWDDGACLECDGDGAVSDRPHESWGAPVRMPRPPAVMKKPCADCAYRAGSPEQDYARILPGPERPFWCHHGTPMVRGDYVPACTDKLGRPVGLMVCGGWWATATGDEQALATDWRQMPEREYAESGKPINVLDPDAPNGPG